MRISLLEAYTAIHDHDLIGIVETHLDETVVETKYSFIKGNHPVNTIKIIINNLFKVGYNM